MNRSVYFRDGRLLGWILLIEPGVFIMERGMLHGLRARAEGNPLDPSQETLYKLAFAALLAFYLLLRYGDSLRRRPKAQASPPLSRTERLMSGLVLLALLPALLYPLTPWLDRLHLAFPGWLRWLGASLFLAGDLLFFWTKGALSGRWSPKRGVEQEKGLVVDGPYRYIRHPMYSAMFGITAGMFLLSANPLVGLPYLILVIGMVVKYLEPEEGALLAEFGEEYRAYMQRTGRFLPRLRH